MKVYRSRKAGANIRRTYDELLNMWGIDLEEVMIPIQYGDTHVIICGNPAGKPLVLFHGVGDDPALMWLWNAKVWGGHCRLYAIDTLGGPGKSIPGPKYNKGFDDIVWIDEILDALKLETVCMAGVSHGGYLVQLYTANRRDRVEKAVAMASAVPTEASGNPMKIMMKVFLPEALFPTQKNVYKLVRKMMGKNYQVFTENPLIMEHYIWLLKGFSPMSMKYHNIRSLSEAEITEIRDKVYYLAGKDDPFIKLGGEEALAAERMNVKYYEGVGHGINHEAAGEINQEVMKLLECSKF